MITFQNLPPMRFCAYVFKVPGFEGESHSDEESQNERLNGHWYMRSYLKQLGKVTMRFLSDP